MPRPHQTGGRLALTRAALLALVGGCVPAAQRPAPLSCTLPCGVVRTVTFPDRLEVTLHVAPGTRLKNAALSSLKAPACKSGVPVVEVSADEQAYLEGPAWIEPHGSLSLRFPFTADGDAPEAAVSPPVSLDLDLEGPAVSRCLRLPLPDPGTGWLAFARRLSLRLEPRE